jgi:hypothetical protein
LSTKASRYFRVAQPLGLDASIPLERVDLSLICARCEKVANSVNQVKRKTKSGLYLYKQWRHRDNRKKGGYLYHYARVQGVD